MRVVPLLAYLVLSSMAFAAAPPRPTLLDLAKKKFAPRELTHAEEKVFMSTELGEPASALTGDDKQDDPANAANWPDARVVHAECVAWLCTDREASSRVTSRGIQIYGMRIDGKLDLEFAQAPFPFQTWKCVFTDEIRLRHAHFAALYLQFTQVKNVIAEGANIDGNVFLRYGFRSEGEINLLGATIGGNLDCDHGAHLTNRNANGKTLNADGAKINGYVFLRDGFKSEGEVNLLGATIGRNLECEGAQLSNPKGKALNADGAKINGGVFLRNGFKSEGEVNLIGATIAATLDCTGAQLSNPNGKALNADGAKIDGSAFLRNGFTAQGEVNLLGATIGRNLDCDHGAHLSNRNGRALNADGTNINGYVFLRDGFKSEGEINLLGATIGRNLECDGAQFSNPKGKTLNADGAKIDSVFLRNGFKSEGEVGLMLATIGRNLECDGAQFTNPNGKALNADGAKIDGSVFLRKGFKAKGQVNLIVATIGATLDCTGAQLFNPGGIGLQASGIKIGGSVFLSDGFEADGGVQFVASEIKSYLYWYKNHPAKNTWFELRSAKIGTFRDEGESWPLEGKLFVDGFTYDRISEDSPLTAKSRIEWLHRQPRNKFLPQPYEQLASVLRNMGHEREARLVMIEKNQDRANFTKRFSQEWWWYNVFGRLIGYGYAPSRAFFISLGMIALGWLLFHLCYVRNIITPTDERGYMKDPAGQIVLENGRRLFSQDYPKFNALVFSLESFTPLLKLDQSESWTPNANRGVSIHFLGLHCTTGSLARVYLWFHIVAGWVLTSLWVGGITGLVKS